MSTGATENLAKPASGRARRARCAPKGSDMFAAGSLGLFQSVRLPDHPRPSSSGLPMPGVVSPARLALGTDAGLELSDRRQHVTGWRAASQQFFVPLGWLGSCSGWPGDEHIEGSCQRP
jgi:hypothetical protein